MSRLKSLLGSRDGKTPGRNDPCHCGSGRKYKNCCLGKSTSRSDPAPAAPGSGERYSGHFAALRSLRDRGRFLEAIEAARDYLRTHPNDAEGYAELGLSLLHAGRAEEALHPLLLAARLGPQVADHHESAGFALEVLGRDGEAITAYRTAIGLNSRSLHVHERLGNLLSVYERNAEAAACFRIAASSGDAPRRAANLAKALRLEDRTDQAEATLKEAVAGGNDSALNRITLATMLRERGRFDEAIENLELATEGTPAEAADAYYNITQIKRVTEDDRPMLAPIAALLEYRSVPESVHQAAHFALGKAYDDLGEYPAAMRHYEAGNQLVARRRPADRAHFGASVYRLITRTGPEFFAGRTAGNSAELPVLIVGMPRSGTTLVEQILSSHRSVTGAGELSFWNRAAEALGKLSDEAAIAQWLTRTGAEYIDRLRGLAPGSLRVTDKTPGNFLWLGLYHLALPRGRIVHVRRHPIDTCLSNYFTLFMARSNVFAYDKGDLAFYYRAYRRLMAHWREVLPANVLLEIDYEELVADPEPVTRRLIDFLGLDWDSACLRPEENRREVRTASQWQVRQKTYSTSVERWRRYEKWLGELAGLADEDDSDGPIDPQSDNAAISRARKLSEEQRVDEAIAVLQEALRTDPRDPVLYSELGLGFLRAERATEARECFERALGLNPNFAIAHYNLGAVLERLAEPEAAIASLRRALALAPDMGAAYSRLGNLLQTRGKEAQALECFGKARDLLPASSDQELEEAKMLRSQSRHEAAEAKLRRVIELAPQNSLAHAMLGDLLGEAGRFDEAISYLRRAVTLDPDRISALFNIANLRRVQERDRGFVAEMEGLLARPRRGVLEQTLLNFALGKAYDDLGEPSKAIRHFDAANALERRKHKFDRDALEAQVDALMASPLPQTPPDPASERALFIIGMPRSGTTLVEQILSAHPAVGGGGELTFWVDAMQRTGASASALRAEYLALLDRLAPGAARVTDKNPFCFLAVPLIRAALPGARFIHCRRDPVDTCLSIYFTRFATPLPFAYDRDDLAFYYRQYSRLMAHWRAVMPADRYLEVDYDRLTESPQEQTRRMVDFTGLAWDERCLAPESNPRMIRTASLWQARQPVYRQSVSRRERYAEWLGALSSLTASGEAR